MLISSFCCKERQICFHLDRSLHFCKVILSFCQQLYTGTLYPHAFSNKPGRVPKGTVSWLHSELAQHCMLEKAADTDQRTMFPRIWFSLFPTAKHTSTDESCSPTRCRVSYKQVDFAIFSKSSLISWEKCPADKLIHNLLDESQWFYYGPKWRDSETGITFKGMSRHFGNRIEKQLFKCSCMEPTKVFHTDGQPCSTITSWPCHGCPE